MTYNFIKCAVGENVKCYCEILFHTFIHGVMLYKCLSFNRVPF